MNKLLPAIAAAALLAAPAAAQSATATLDAASTTISPGGSITVSLVVDFSTGAAGPGLFGPAGLYGFGGSIEASGAAAGDVNASAVTTASNLQLGPVASTGGSGSELASAAAGRLLADGALAVSPQTVATFTIDVDPAATDGDTVTLSYDGAVVLALDDTLATYSTSPGANQQTLTTVDLTLTVGAGRLCADQNGDGAVTPGDFNGWIINFNQGSLIADTNQDGVLSPGDFNGWVLAFNGGQNGPICTP